jgi:hypothetical protein
MFTQPPLTSTDKPSPGIAESFLPGASAAGAEASHDTEDEGDGVPRYLEEEAAEGSGQDRKEIAGESEDEIPERKSDVPAPAFGDEEALEKADNADESESAVGETEEEGEDEIRIDVEPEDPGKEVDVSENLREELKTYVDGVRHNLDTLPESNKTESGKEKLPLPPKKPGRLLDYLSNMTNYLPQEAGFQSRENEMRVKLETVRGRLSGKKGLFRYIENSFRPQPSSSGGGLTSEKLVSTFSFMKDLSCFMPDPKMSMLIRRKIDAILGKMRHVSG